MKLATRGKSQAARQFSNIHKSTINLDSKLAREERVLIVDENDQPVRAATRLEMVRNYLTLQTVYRDSRIYGTGAHAYMS